MNLLPIVSCFYILCISIIFLFFFLFWKYCKKQKCKTVHKNVIQFWICILNDPICCASEWSESVEIPIRIKSIGWIVFDGKRSNSFNIYLIWFKIVWNVYLNSNNHYSINVFIPFHKITKITKQQIITECIRTGTILFGLCKWKSHASSCDGTA